MTMVAQLAVCLAFELNLHQDVPSTTSRTTTQGSQKQHVRTLEERRTILALFHLTSS